MLISPAAACSVDSASVEGPVTVEAMEYTMVKPCELDVAKVTVKQWLLPRCSDIPVTAPFLDKAKVVFKLAEDWTPLKGGMTLTAEELFPGESVTTLAAPFVMSGGNREVLKALDGQCKQEFRKRFMADGLALTWYQAVRETHVIMYLALDNAKSPMKIRFIDDTYGVQEGFGTDFLLAHVGDLGKLGDWLCRPLVVEAHSIRTDYEARSSRLILLVHSIIFVRNRVTQTRFDVTDEELSEIVQSSKRIRADVS
jgi:hypothetical protein